MTELKRTNVLLTNEMLEYLDVCADMFKTSRSTVIRMLLAIAIRLHKEGALII